MARVQPGLRLAQGLSALLLGQLASAGVLFVSSRLPLPERGAGAALLVGHYVIPLLVSCLLGLFWGGSRPAAMARSLLAAVAIAAVLLPIELVGSWMVLEAVWTDESSEAMGYLAARAFIALCAALAAPLTAALAPRERVSLFDEDRPRGDRPADGADTPAQAGAATDGPGL